MAETRTEYGVINVSSGIIMPVSKEAGERFLASGDGPRLKLITRTVTVSGWESITGTPITVLDEKNGEWNG